MSIYMVYSIVTFSPESITVYAIKEKQKIDIVIKSSNHFDGGKHLLSYYKSNGFVLHWFILIVYIRAKIY